MAYDKPELYHDNFQNYKSYQIPKAQLVIADIPYNIGDDAYGSNPTWYIGGDNRNGESEENQMKVKRAERGWVGHFIMGHKCLFRRNTLIECGDKRVVVSTVGNLIDDYSGEHTTIAYKTWYETMAFKAVLINGYWDADVSNIIDFESEDCLRAETWSELIEKYPLVDNVANDMHEKVVEDIARRLRKTT